MNNKDVIALTERFVAGTYARFPVAMVSGEGARLWDADGKEYLDFLSGIAVCNLGHCHPKVVEAIRKQAGELLHVSNLYHIVPQAELARTLCENSFAEKVFFCNSGSEANEAAIKLVRKYFNMKGEARPRLVTMERSFHGRTFAALAATGQKKYQAGFEPLLEKFTYIPFNDLAAAEKAIDRETAAVLVEPIQGEGGVNVPSDEYLKGLKEVCSRTGTLLIFDEVQVGLGRTGKLFAYEHSGVTPDIMTLAKALGGGVAIGAMCATDRVAEAFTPGTHASTFGGNPLATAAGHAALRATLEDGVLDNATRVGGYLVGRLRELKSSHGFIKEVRGKGLIIGMELDIEAAPVVRACLDRGLLINSAGEKIVRFIPPLVVTEKEVDEMLGILAGVLAEAE